MFQPRNIALLYALYAAIGVLLLALLMPPMQNADEAAHAFRAAQISHGGLLGEKIPDGEFGGIIDSGLTAVQAAVSVLPGPTDQKVTRAMVTPRAWGEEVPFGFPNTAINPPLFYLPAALAAAVTRARAIPLPHALVLMRLANGAATLLIGAAAIALAGDAAIWLFTLLLLPMSLGLAAAISQDGPMLACAALAAGLHLRIRRSGFSHARLAYAVLCFVLAAIATARPPYAALAVLAATAPLSRLWRLLGTGFILASILAWTLRSAGYLPMPVRPDGIVAPAAQLSALLLHFWRIPFLAWRALTAGLARSFIGQLGRLDVGLPAFYHTLAWCALALAALVTWRFTSLARARWLDVLAIAAAIAGVGLAQYLTWTVVGSPTIEGLQGRYFLVPATMLAVILCNPERPAARLWRWPAVPLLLLPIATLAVATHAIVLRYYF